MAIKDRLTPKEQLVQKTMNIDDRLYERLEALSKTKYEASVSKIINACVYELSEAENLVVYDTENEVSSKHTVIFKQSTLNKLEKLRKKYKLSVYKLVNIAIKNVIDELEK